MDKEKELDRELGKMLMRSRYDNLDAAKDELFKTDPEKAVMRYPYDQRTWDILGQDEWIKRFGTED